MEQFPILDPIFHSYVDVIYLILTKILRVDTFILPLLQMKKLRHRDIVETWVQCESQNSAFSTITLCCLLEVHKLGG